MGERQKPCSSHLLALQEGRQPLLSLHLQIYALCCRWSFHEVLKLPLCVCLRLTELAKDQRLASMQHKQGGQLKVSLLWSTCSRERVKNHESNPSSTKRLVQTLMRLLLRQILACLKFWNLPCPSPACNNQCDIEVSIKVRKAVCSLSICTLSRNPFFKSCLRVPLSSFFLLQLPNIFFLHQHRKSGGIFHVH